MYYTFYTSPIGKIKLISDGVYLNYLLFEKDKDNITSKESLKKDNLEIFKNTKSWLDDYFSKKNPSLDKLKLSPNGSSFRKEVWKLLLDIDYGKVVTYKEITKKIEKLLNKRMSAQAVGGAIGSNPIPIIIPCHRVVGSNKSLTGYSGGIDIKIRLLQLENINTNEFSIPKK